MNTPLVDAVNSVANPATVAASMSTRYRFAHFELQLEERRLLSNQVAVALRPLAFDILAFLVARPGQLVTQDKLMQAVWGRVVVEVNTLQVHVSALRKVLGPGVIATVSGRGYRFMPTVETLEAPGAAGDVVAGSLLRPARGGHHNLPRPLATFIGRERETAEIRSRLASARLLTLTGAGGCGKTRLALHVALGLLDDYPDGIRLVEFARLSDPAFVVQTLAKSLGLEAEPDRDTIDVVVDWLKSQRMLLVLDNAEHLIEACARLTERLLRQCPKLSVLVTSRERLGVDGESTYRVPSLSLPESDHGAEVLACEAARLLLDRVRLQQPDFSVDARSTAALAAICRRLDGIALAIELAAPRLQVMSLEHLDRRLDDLFGILTGGARTALPRHRTLRSLIDWSYELLDAREKLVLQRASVFAGGWTLEAAEHVCSGGQVSPGDVLILLGSLVDKSLVVMEAGQGTRFTMMETLRHYARERLRDGGGEAEAHERLMDHLAGIAEGLDVEDDEVLWQTLARLDPEHANLRAVFGWCERMPSVAQRGLGLAASMGWFWQVRGAYDEAFAWLTRLLAVAHPQHGENRALALHMRGLLKLVGGGQDDAAADLQQAVALWRELGRLWQLGRSLVILAEVEHLRGRMDISLALSNEALTLLRKSGDRRFIADAMKNLAMLACVSGDLASARTWSDESLRVSRAVGPWVMAGALNTSSIVRRLQGDATGSVRELRESLDAYRQFGDRGGACTTATSLAKIQQDIGDLAGASSYLSEAWHWLPSGHCNEELQWLDTAACVMRQSDAPLEAIRVWSCVEQSRGQRGINKRSMLVERQQAVARSQLAGDRFDRAWQEGLAWSPDEAVRVVRSWLGLFEAGGR